MVKLRHREDNSPSRYSGQEVTSEPGDVFEVDEETADRLLERPYFVREEDADADADAEDDAGADATVTTGDFQDDEVEVADRYSEGKSEAQQMSDNPPREPEQEDPAADRADREAETADFRDDEIEVADADSEGKTEAQQEREEAQEDADADDYQEPDDDPDPTGEGVAAEDADDEADADAEADADTDGDQYQDLVADGTVADVREAIEGGEVDDLDALQRAEEEYGGDRVGVADAIESAREADQDQDQGGEE